MTLLFIISFLGILLMVGSKVFQIKVRKIKFLNFLSLKGDAFLRKWIGFGIGKYSLYRKIARLFVFDFLPSYVYEQLVSAKDYVAKKYYQLGTEFQGRRVLRNTGSVSFFLESLAAEKPENK